MFLSVTLFPACLFFFFFLSLASLSSPYLLLMSLLACSLPVCFQKSLHSLPSSQVRMLRRLLERPCTLALLVGSQLAVMMYLSLGGFRSLSALFGRDPGPTFDYSHPHDVYSNLSHLPAAPGAAGAPPAQALPYCPERSPFLGE